VESAAANIQTVECLTEFESLKWLDGIQGMRRYFEAEKGINFPLEYFPVSGGVWKSQVLV